MGPTASVAVRHSEGKGALAQEEDLGAIETSWDTLRVAAVESPTMGKARVMERSSASAGVTRCNNMPFALVSALIPEVCKWLR